MSCHIEFKFLCKSADLSEGQFRQVLVGQGQSTVDLILHRRDGVAIAWLNLCPHQGRPLNWAFDRFLTDEAGQLVCANHGAVFETVAGRCINGPCRGAELRAVRLIEEGGSIHFKSENNIS